MLKSGSGVSMARFGSLLCRQIDCEIVRPVVTVLRTRNKIGSWFEPRRWRQKFEKVAEQFWMSSYLEVVHSTYASRLFCTWRNFLILLGCGEQIGGYILPQTKSLASSQLVGGDCSSPLEVPVPTQRGK